ncbi:MAG: hypothetical protein JWN44_999, partial [Myxococcales bacterium]|nr:hypothetical protein [Myxococcales bacterium]
MRNALAGFGVLCVVVWVSVWATYRLPSSAPLSPAARAALVARARNGERFARPERIRPGAILVTNYAAGLPVDGAPTPASRIKVDVVMARASIVSRSDLVFALSLVPGLDGVGVDVGDREAYLSADELMRADALAAAQPLQAMEFELGADRGAIDTLLRKQLGMEEGDYARQPRRYFRFRTDAFIESADHRGVVPVLRGNTPGPTLSKESLRAAAVAGGRYLLRHLYDDGRFGYEYTPAKDLDEAYGLDYSLPRHAGGSYFLAQLYGATHDTSFRDGAARALQFLARRQPDACGRIDRSCIANKEVVNADLGAAAMSLLAVVEFEAATGTHEHLTWARRLAQFLVYMQKPDGDFCHLFDFGRDRRDEKTKMLYYSGEAAFALAKLTALIGPSDPDYKRYAGALDRGLDYLTGAQYATLAGQFYFGEDHWTCMAADAGWDALPPEHRVRYARFCDQFVAFLRRTQFTPRDAAVAAQPDFVGAYGFSPLLPPHATPVGSRSETTVSSYAMMLRRGTAGSDEGRATLEQIRLGMQFLLDHQ